MRKLLITLIAIAAAIQLSALLVVVSVVKTPEQASETLLPPFLAPRRFSDLQQGLKNSAKDVCIANALQVQKPAWLQSVKNPVRRDGSLGRRAEVTAYLVCHINEMRKSPQKLCVGRGKERLARYTRGYFRLLAELRDAPAQPPALIIMQQRSETGSDIQTGNEDFSPDQRIIDGLKALIRDGVYTGRDELTKLLSPEVPSSVLREMASVEPGDPACARAGPQ